MRTACSLCREGMLCIQSALRRCLGRSGNGATTLGPQKPSPEAVRWLDGRRRTSRPRRRTPAPRTRTLYANILDGQWRPLRGICPSPFRYRGVWSWDAAYHAMAISHWDAKLAREQIQIFLDRQLPSGLFCTSYGRRRKRGRRRIWQAAGVGLGLRDHGSPQPGQSYLKQIYPKFAANAAFWQRERGGRQGRAVSLRRKDTQF